METITEQHLSEKDFRRLGAFIYSESGIKMPESKKVMLEARLRRRLKALGLADFASYCEYLFSPRGQTDEVTHMLDAVTTNKTDFFREPSHFTYLINHALPSILRNEQGPAPKNIMIWSAGCSTGEEPYSLSMVLRDFEERTGKIRFTIIATDLSTAVLRHASNAVYEEERVEQMPPDMMKKYLMRSRDRSRRLVRIVPELRQRVRFRRLNFMDDDFGFREKMDIIFCRNVIIYFDRQTQERLLRKFCDHLRIGGYLFMGHSETIHGFELPLEAVAPTVYRKLP